MTGADVKTDTEWASFSLRFTRRKKRIAGRRLHIVAAKLQMESSDDAPSPQSCTCAESGK
jgi:hypothetical protein